MTIPLRLHWLDEAPDSAVPAQWGAPWPRGALTGEPRFVLAHDGGRSAVDTWGTARWPDGSVKWTGHAALAPSAETLDRLAYRVTVIGFPIFGVGIIMGAVWAESAWGRFWGWDPKETGSFITWVLYAVYLHARATTGWGAKRAAWINIAAFSVHVFNLFFINMVVSGLHSYAGLN